MEVLNYYAGRGAKKREAAATLANKLCESPNVIVLPQTSIQFREGIKFYASRGDKAWSLTDCCSFKAMEEYQIREALAYDRHFEQAGVRVLLRENCGE